MTAFLPLAYDEVMTKQRYLSEWEVYCRKMGWDPDEKTVDDAVALSPKRYRSTAHLQFETGHLYRLCEVCARPMCVTNGVDRKPRTPKLKKIAICPSCDPRHPEDRHLHASYRVLHPDRLRIFKMYLVTRMVMTRDDSHGDCKCIHCVARRIINLEGA